MKGLELAESYYRKYGARMIKEKFPQYQDRIAAGLVGDGSECYGFDDGISRDHDWGPCFCLWLNKADFEIIGHALHLEYQRLPKYFNGCERIASPWGKGRVGVFEIGTFYRKFIGLPHAPKTPEQWLCLPEAYLSSCTNGRVFYDPPGQFSQIRKELLGFYPEDIRLVKIAARCMTAAQSGQYNYMRSVRRKAYYAAQYAETQFCTDIMSLVFLLNRQYMPYYKWSHHALCELPLLGKFLHQKIDDMAASHNYETKNDIIEEISAAVIRMLHQERLSDSASDFLLDHGPVVHAKIRDKNLRQRDVWIG
ncbi:DUF4037 domain-containing protein [Desulfonema magnum]|uniref:Uncharacterized protein associated with anaerobic p-cresol degradation gene cluster n=1 Tax=Desulfonema magnum TaxID=45655 RepID=A0A975GT89_9BACT|nr:DUF4037 domain-containing protein [Desulfonema magnum]QTA92865.1 Uncharacterized protein associated with anaerobic p-cresol degradation gene cluster [Desulfonema magnum]